MLVRKMLTTLLLFVAAASIGPAQAQTNLTAMKTWAGKYPTDRVQGLTFLDQPEVQLRINSALGPDAASQMKAMAIVGPILERRDWLIAYGCQPHMCADGKWWVAINLTNYEIRACLALVNSPTVRFGASDKKYIDLPRGGEGVCLEPEKTIARFDQVLAGVVAPVPSAVFATPSFDKSLSTALNKNPTSRSRVSLKSDGGTFGVPIEINGTLTLDFIVDSGAADVSVPADVFSTLIRTGTIKPADIIGEQTYVLADGSKSKFVTFTIRSLKIGDKIIENVKGSVAPSHGSLLLGQSFLGRFKSWSIDNTNHELLLDLQ